MDLRDRPRDDRGSDHPSHDTRDPKKQDRGEDEFVRGVSAQLDKRHTFRLLVGYGFIHRLPPSVAAHITNRTEVVRLRTENRDHPHVG